MTSLVLRKVRGELSPVLVVPKVISEGVLKLERLQVICPACGEQVEAVATDGRVKGYCAVAKQYVDFLIETQLERKKYQQTPEYRAKMSAAMKKTWQDPEYRVKQNATMKKTRQNPEYRDKQSAAHMGKHLTAETNIYIA